MTHWWTEARVAAYLHGYRSELCPRVWAAAGSAQSGSGYSGGASSETADMHFATVKADLDLALRALPFTRQAAATLYWVGARWGQDDIARLWGMRSRDSIRATLYRARDDVAARLCHNRPPAPDQRIDARELPWWMPLVTELYLLGTQKAMLVADALVGQFLPPRARYIRI